MKRLCIALLACIALLLSAEQTAYAYPAYAQAAYANPREATGKIVCANCHLAQKQAIAEIPQAVTPGQIFDVKVKIPYDTSVQQVLGDGSKGGLNVGAVVMLPEGFRMATEDEMTPEQKAATAETYISTYSDESPNVLVVGPIAGEANREIIFPVKAPDPSEDPTVSFMKYKVYVGGNRGRGQLNPDGSYSNNTAFRAPVTGQVASIQVLADPAELTPEAKARGVNVEDAYSGTRVVTFKTDKGLSDLVIPPGSDLLVAVGDELKEGDALTDNPNVGGFGQVERDLVLQSPDRVKWLVAFLAAVALAQLMLVLKKKQIEQIQGAEALS